MSGIEQTEFAWFEGYEPAPTLAKASRTGAFTDNMKLPVHRWFRYSAGFSAEWVEKTIRGQLESGGRFFDPFAGSATSLLSAQAAGFQSAGAESHPFVSKIAWAKLGWQQNPASLHERATILLERAKRDVQLVEPEAPLIDKCYTEESLIQLQCLRRSLEEEPEDHIKPLLWLAITAILRECSGVGTAQWQYILPNKTKARTVAPFDAFVRRVSMFTDDMRIRSRIVQGPASAVLQQDDARQLSKFEEWEGKVALVITSPPYPNNYDYADATRLEMTFWRDIRGWGELHQSVRKKLITSCSQHSAADKLNLEDLLSRAAVEPILPELSVVCRNLEEIRQTKGGKKTYHTMVGAYFNDLSNTFLALRKLCAKDSDVCFVIGDSAPYGVHVPAEKWLSELAVAAGFKSPRFEKIRDRNLKWKNRKHRVPLQEGNLWMRG